MVRKKTAPVTFATVRRFAMALANVEEGTSYGTPAFKTRGKLFIRLREDHESIVVRVPEEQREEMMAADPGTYHITEHYRDYPQWMLVRLSTVHPDALEDLIRGAWRLASPARQKNL